MVQCIMTGECFLFLLIAGEIYKRATISLFFLSVCIRLQQLTREESISITSERAEASKVNNEIHPQNMLCFE